MAKVVAVKKDIYPYRYVRHEAKRVVKGVEYHIFSHGAYDAFGLIGPEYNGVVVADVTNRRIIVDDGIGPQSGWYDGYDNDSRVQELALRVQQLANCSPSKFIAHLQSHPRTRGLS